MERVRVRVGPLQADGGPSSIGPTRVAFVFRLRQIQISIFPFSGFRWQRDPIVEHISLFLFVRLSSRR